MRFFRQFRLTKRIRDHDSLRRGRRAEGFAASFILAAICFFGLFGCGTLEKNKNAVEIPGKAPNIVQSGAALTENMVGVEIFYIRISPQQDATLQQLWREVDEMVLDASFRHRLREEGLRVGILGAYLTTALSELLNITDSTTEGREKETDGMSVVSVADVPLAADVVRHYRNLMPDMSASLPPHDSVIDELSRFWVEDGKLCGKTYYNARGMIRLSAKPLPNGKVRFQLVPELEHGQVMTKFVTHAHIMSIESGKPRQTFEELAVSLDLLPGQWIVMGPTAANSTGIGRDFFIREKEKLEQKIVAIRLVRMKNESQRERSRLPQPRNPASVEIPERI